VTAHSDPTEELDGRFRLEGETVAGGMGVVYRAVDLTTGEVVAASGGMADVTLAQVLGALQRLRVPA